MKIFYVLIFMVLLAQAEGLGIISSLKGNATISRNGQIIPAKIGQTIFLNDHIQTEGRTKVQILFDDKSVISLGTNSSFEISEYVNDTLNPKASFKIERGFFKVITGKIGKLAPDKFRIVTRTSSIGIRGTHLLGLIKQTMDSVACTNGSIKVISHFDQSSVNVYAGQITFVEQGKPPMVPRDFNMQELQQLSMSNSVSSTTIDEDIAAVVEETTQEVVEVVEEPIETVQTILASNTISKKYEGSIVGAKYNVATATYSSGNVAQLLFTESSGTQLLVKDASHPEGFIVNLNNINGSFVFDGKTIDIGVGRGFKYTQDGMTYYIESYSTQNLATGVHQIYAGLSSGDLVGSLYGQSLNHLTYGHWYMDDGDYTYDAFYDTYVLASETQTQAYYGSFIAGEVSPISVVQKYLNSTQIVNYTGSVYINNGTTGTFNLTFDFGSATPITGVVAGGSLLAGGSISETGFNTSSISGVNGLVEGKFYGPNLEEVGGVYINNDTPELGGTFAGAASAGLF